MKITRQENETVEEMLDRLKKVQKKDRKTHNFYEKKRKRKGGRK